VEFYIDIGRSGEIKEKFKEMIKEMRSYEEGLLSVSNEISKISGFEEMEETVAILYEEVHAERQDLERMLDTYKKCVQCYKDTEEKIASSQTFDWHMLLDIGGLVPGIGMACDGINAGWYAAEKDWGNALLSGMSFIPVIGEVSGIGKVGAKAISHADDIADIAKAAERMEDAAKAADDVADVSKGLKGIKKSGKYSGLLDELANSGVKYNPEDIVAIAKTADGKLVWLENGTDTAGLNHIITEHADDFLNIGITQEQIPDYIMNALENGKIIGYQGRGTGRPIYEFTYNGEICKVAITVGNNGFIVGANPK